MAPTVKKTLPAIAALATTCNTLSAQAAKPACATTGQATYTEDKCFPNPYTSAEWEPEVAEAVANLGYTPGAFSFGNLINGIKSAEDCVKLYDAIYRARGTCAVWSVHPDMDWCIGRASYLGKTGGSPEYHGSLDPADSDIFCAPGLAQDCVMGEWTDWGECSATCGSGASKTRTREITTQPDAEGQQCGAVEEIQTCAGLPACPQDCVMTEWSAYGECTATCGEGMQTRSRSVATPADADASVQCPTDLEETQVCPDLKPCDSNSGASPSSSGIVGGLALSVFAIFAA